MPASGGKTNIYSKYSYFTKVPFTWKEGDPPRRGGHPSLLYFPVSFT